MKTVSKQFSHLWNCAGAVLKKAVLPVYGNGQQTVLLFMELHWRAVRTAYGTALAGSSRSLVSGLGLQRDVRQARQRYNRVTHGFKFRLES